MSATTRSSVTHSVPFFRPMLTDTEIEEVVDTLRSGWLTTGPKVERFQTAFAAKVGARHAVAVNSCTAALHLAVEALGLASGDAVLVPTMTFAATAEVIRYRGAIPILVDCEPESMNLNIEDAETKLDELARGSLRLSERPSGQAVGIIPVHVGGLMGEIDRCQAFARRHGLWIVEDAAHAFPAAWRSNVDSPWQFCGQETAAVTCFSFYANKTITTGEGGMAVTSDAALAERIRMLSLHGLSNDAWSRYSNDGKWDYRIVAPGYKYNLTDIAAAIGIHQLARSEQMRLERERIAKTYIAAMSDLHSIQLPGEGVNRIHSWHLFPIRLRLETLAIDRNRFIEELKKEGIGCTVHWRPLHLHPYYRDGFGWKADDFPVATAEWQRLVSLPIFPGMRESEIERVVGTVRMLCERYAV
jgi:perosamine synthetase